jgi:hypothetical protein
MLNSTKDYHIYNLSTLGWELTMCNALWQKGTPLRGVLDRDDSFGHLLFDYLAGIFPMREVRRVLEIGGGYGYLMKDFLDRNPSLKPLMLDISPRLLEKQKEALKGEEVLFKEGDFLETAPSDIQGFDMAIMNENLGDFPTLVDIDSETLHSSPEPADPDMKKAVRFLREYGLETPEGASFNLNTGAMEAMELLCASWIPFIYVGEHSCEASVPPDLRPFLCVEPAGNPERISLMGHDEYTIRFSHLERIAQAFDYVCFRGLFADFVTFKWTERIRSIMISRGRFSDEDEMVCQFIEDLYKYEYLIAIKRTATVGLAYPP